MNGLCRDHEGGHVPASERSPRECSWRWEWRLRRGPDTLHQKDADASRQPDRWSWSSGAVLQSKATGFAMIVQLAVTVVLGPALDHPGQPIRGNAPLNAEHSALRHVQGLGHPKPRPAFVGLEKDAARVVTLAELFRAGTKCPNWLRSSGVSRGASFSLTTPPPHNIVHVVTIPSTVGVSSLSFRPSWIKH